MTEEINFFLDLADEQMEESILHLERTLSKIRAGKANPQMLRSVSINYYGVQTPLSQASNISIPDPQTITIQPFDTNLISDIEHAIVEANLGFNPSNNGEKVIINVPPLTEERRKELVKQAKVEIENAKISIRNVRQKTNEEIKKIGKQGVSEDIIRESESNVQEKTNIYSSKIDKIFSQKESEIMTV